MQKQRPVYKAIKFTSVGCLVGLGLLGWGLFWFTYFFERFIERQHRNFTARHRRR